MGGGLFTLGAYTRQPRLIPLGGIALAISAIWAAASAGFHWQEDNTDIKSLYTSIVLDPERLADNALYQLFHYYQEGMFLQPTVCSISSTFCSAWRISAFLYGVPVSQALLLVLWMDIHQTLATSCSFCSVFVLGATWNLNGSSAIWPVVQAFWNLSLLSHHRCLIPPAK